MGLWEFLIQSTALLALGAVLGMLSERLGFTALIGYLVAGLILGPGGAALVDTAHVAPVAEIGVALLLFSIGLEFSFSRLRRLGRAALWGGLLQVVLTAALFAALALAFGLRMREAIAVGAVLSLSSTASVLRLLQERTELETVAGRSSLGILLLQDLAVVPLVLLITFLGETGTLPQIASEAGLAVGSGLLLLIGLLAAGRLFLPRLLTHAALTRNRELSILSAVVICLAATWSAHALGMSPALGAFIAGMVLAESPFATQIRADIGSLRALFVALFFAAVGMLADPGSIVRHGALVPLVMVAILALKAALVAVILVGLRLPLRHAVASGMALSQVGEFGFVLLQAAGDVRLLPDEVTEILLLSIFGTLLLTPFLLPLGPRLGLWLETVWRRGRRPIPFAEGDAPDRAGHVLIVGYGPAGQGAAEGVRRSGAPLLVIDANPRVLDLAREHDLPAIVGDATYPELLQHARIGQARALVITVPDHGTALAVLQLARGLAPDLPIIVRARYHRFASSYEEAGATRVYDEEFSAGESLAGLLEQCLPSCGR